MVHTSNKPCTEILPRQLTAYAWSASMVDSRQHRHAPAITTPLIAHAATFTSPGSVECATTLIVTRPPINNPAAVQCNAVEHRLSVVADGGSQQGRESRASELLQHGGKLSKLGQLQLSLQKSRSQNSCALTGNVYRENILSSKFQYVNKKALRVEFNHFHQRALAKLTTGMYKFSYGNKL